jgi:hypothetical protein
MFYVRVGVIVDLMEHPSVRVISVVTDVESPAPAVFRHGFTGVMKQRLFELRPHFRTNGHKNEDDVHGTRW